MRRYFLCKLFGAFIAVIVFSNCSGIPKSFKEQALDDMFPLLTNEQFQEMKSLSGETEIKKFIDSYWENLEPSLVNGKSVLREEYESRLEYANRHFPDRRGWGRSDRKMIYMIYGPPSYIERKDFTNIPLDKFSTIKSMEIWLYMNPEDKNSFPSRFDNIHRGEQKFIFADVSGSGIYKILYSNEANEYLDVRVIRQ